MAKKEVKDDDQHSELYALTGKKQDYEPSDQEKEMYALLGHYASGGEVEAPTAFDADETPEKNDADSEKVVSSHPGNQPNDLGGYIKGQEAQIDKFGPEQEKAVMDSLIRERKGFPNALGQAGSSFADALLQVGGGTPQFRDKYDTNFENRQKMQQEEIPNLATMNEKQMAQKQSLEGKTSSSPLGKSYVDSFKPIAQKLFPQMDEAAWQKISSNPSALEKMFGQAIDIKKAEAEIAMKEAMLGATSEHYRNEAKNQEAQRREEAKKQKMDALKETAKNPFFMHPFEARKAQDEIAKIGQGGDSFSPDVVAYAQKHNITPEQAQEVKNRRTGGQ